MSAAVARDRERPATAVRLGVLGWPVAHSRSPQMQNAALAAVGLVGWRYQLLPAPPELLEEIVQGLPGAGFRGVNVTIPHKAAALALATAPTERAQEIGAANTLTFEPDGTTVADNTDGPALADALHRTVPRLLSDRGARALVLGAGGSARAAVWALRDAGVAEVRIWNRTPQRAIELARTCGEGVSATPTAEPADVLVNCTSVGLDGSDPFDRLPLDAEQLSDYGAVADYVYTADGSRLIDATRRRGIVAVDGLELLVVQGALAFERFTGHPAPIEVMRAAVGGHA